MSNINWAFVAYQTPHRTYFLMYDIFHAIIHIQMRNSGPEKLVEKEVTTWAEYMGFDLTVVDTAAVWNPMAGRYLRRQQASPCLI